MNKKIIQAIFILFFITSSFLISTSKGAGMGMGGPPIPCGGGPFAPCPIPIDGGISVLFIVGAAYGGKKIYDATKKNPT